ncbi:MAG: 5-(carboxyamino)imidazole ribonucleotide mutase [Abditibacteriales bacterium]|nr:5-(carboxyamino)imidazole ribonucleotide mutase [Abditibacteriales bacterium]
MNHPLVGIIMGSDSDLPIMKEAAETLEEFGVSVEVRVISAHRTPDVALAWARGAKGRGIKVIIAGAGGAAHLPGVLAALTPLPVIGVPVKTSTLSGVDSLYSIVQMPPGVPVATVGINAAKNAALLALQILALGDQEIDAKVEAFRQKQADSVAQRDAKLQEVGWKNYAKS